MKLLKLNWILRNEKRLLWLMVILIVVSTIIDLYTAISSEVFEIAETNPIYLMTGNVWILVAINAVVGLWIIYNLGKRISLDRLFLFTLVTMYLVLGHFVGAWSNIQVTDAYHDNPEKVQAQIEAYQAHDKANNYLVLVLVVMIIPLILSYMAFKISAAFYHHRKPLREQYIDKIHNLSYELKYR